MGVPAGDDARIRAGHALDDDVRVERLVEAGRLRAGRGVADQDHRAVLGAQPAFGGQPSQPADPLVAERVVRPFGGRPEGVRHAVGHPRERRRIVEVGDRHVRVAADDRRAVGLHLAQQVDRARRIRAVEHEVAGDRDEIGPLGPDGRPDRLERHGIAMHVGEHDHARHRRTPSLGMMKLSVASHAVSPSTLATPRPRPKRPPSFSIVTCEAERVAGAHDALEAAVVDAREQPDPVPEPRLLGDVHGHRLGQGLHLDDAGHHRQAREMALEIPLARGDALDPDDAPGLRVVLDDAIDEQERPAVRDERFDLAGRVDGFGHGRLQDG